eukprot:SAG11_NODE_360_length_10188_cov_25.643671_5_plen_75_part_00
MDLEKVRSIIKLPRPKDASALRGFLDMASFWRRWMSSYAKIAEPLNELLKNRGGCCTQRPVGRFIVRVQNFRVK